MLKTRVLTKGLMFPECPRWHNGRLWFSDMHAQRVITVDLSGNVELIAEVPGQPAGLGWLPDKRLLVVSMTDRRLLRLEPKGLVLVSDLTKFATFHCNDMVVDAQGRAYVGNFGFDLARPQTFVTTAVVMVDHQGRARIAADNLAFPNGMVITPDGKTLIVAETLAQRLTAFSIEPDGSLSNRHVWAEIPESTPDGICLDAEHAVWIASPATGEVLRCWEGGKVTHRIKPKNPPYACMLGGPHRRTLFICTAETMDPEQTRERHGGMIETVVVEVPGAGLP